MLAAIAPIVGTARIATATGNIVRALGFALETARLDDEEAMRPDALVSDLKSDTSEPDQGAASASPLFCSSSSPSSSSATTAFAQSDDVVARLLVADPQEAAEQHVELLLREAVRGLGVDPAGRDLRLPGGREPHDPLVRPGGLGELLQELVDPRAAFRRQRRDGPGQVRAVVVAPCHARPTSPPASSPTRWRKT